jgi:hypothetical protein
LGGGLATAQAAVDGSISDSTTQTQTAHDQTNQQIVSLSNDLASSLTSQQAAVQSSFATLNATKQQMSDTTKQLLAQYGLSNDQVIQSLSQAISGQQASSVQVSQMLSADFTKLMTNLGGNDPATRSGLIGKLFTISSQVGDTSKVVAATNTSVAAFGNTRAVETRLLDLQTAQFTLMQNRITTYHPFGSDQVNEQVVFIYHVSGQA